MFGDKNITRISYLDVGTNVPDVDNNTYLFYCGGSRGVCVEANPTLIAQIREVRPKDTVLNVGVSVGEATEADFYVFDCNGISTFDKSEADKRLASGRFRLSQVTKVPLVNINVILRDYFDRCPDLLSLDIEGLDLAVLKDLDFQTYSIPVVCVETCASNENHVRPKDAAIAAFMASRGYAIYADTYINTIFVRKAWFENSTDQL